MGNRSFGNVDFKVLEADFFLTRLRAAVAVDDLLTINFHFSAFVSAARSITFAMQAVLSDLADFREWYASQQEKLRNEQVCRLFVNHRNEQQKIGAPAVVAGVFAADGSSWFLASDTDSNRPVESLCETYLVHILRLVADCYRRFGPWIDADQRYTIAGLARVGMSIEDAEAELGFPRGWTDVGDDAEQRIVVLRNAAGPGCEIRDLLARYLGAQNDLW